MRRTDNVFVKVLMSFPLLPNERASLALTILRDSSSKTNRYLYKNNNWITKIFGTFIFSRASHIPGNDVTAIRSIAELTVSINFKIIENKDIQP